MNDLLLRYYHSLDNPTPSNFKEVIELCNLNSHLFKDAFIQEKRLKETEELFYKAQTDVVDAQYYMGVLLCGIALYFDKMKDTYNSRRLFELAKPSSNIVAMVYLNQVSLNNSTYCSYVEMKKRCEANVTDLVQNYTCFILIQRVFFDKILLHKSVLDTTIRQEKERGNILDECKKTTSTTIRNAIELATCTFEFDINNFYNYEELNRLLN